MITFLNGVVVEKLPTRVILNIGGIGYEVFIPISTYECLPKENEECHLLIYDYVRDDQHLLFGFMAEEERSVFVKLLLVTGIGPRLALSTLSSLSVHEIISAVTAGDTRLLSTVSGIGKKVAERIIVELREQFSQSDILRAQVQGKEKIIPRQVVRDAVQALNSLGYNPAKAREKVLAVSSSLKAELSVEKIIRKALSG